MQSVQIGAIRVSVLVDGVAHLPCEMLFPELEPADWDPFRRSYLNDDGTIPVSLGAFLVQTDEQILLVDSGVGLSAAPFGLPIGGVDEGLAECGVDADRVDKVVLTHMHADHIGGCVREIEGALVTAYPNAQYLVDRREWAYWTSDPGAADDPSLPPFLVDSCARPLESSGQLVLHDGGYALDPEIRIMPAPGHTPGHSVVELRSRGESMMIVGDAVHCPAQVLHPEWTIYAGVDKDLERASRREIFERVEHDDMILAAGHAHPAHFGRIRSIAGRQEFEPLAL